MNIPFTSTWGEKMSIVKLEPGLLDEIKSYGAFDVSACFNCGTCTATCPLTEQGSEFPRSMIRLAQIGAKEELLSSKELWLCYYCGECSATCPRQAEPGEFMAAARRYAIAEYDVTGLGKKLYTSQLFNYLTIVVLTIIGLAFVAKYSNPQNVPANVNPIWKHLNIEFIHYGGMILGGILGILLLFDLLRAAFKFKNQVNVIEGQETVSVFKKLWITLKTFFVILFTEVLVHKRYMTDQSHEKPVVLRRWFLHSTIVWGFILSFLATAINITSKVGTDVLQSEGIGKYTSPLFVSHVIGLTGAVLLLWGGTITIYYHLTDKEDKFYSHLHFTDALLLFYVEGIAISGLLTYLFIYIPGTEVIGYYIFVIHLLFVAEFFFFGPVQKAVHMFYRPLALWAFAFEKEIKQLLEKPEVAEEEAESEDFELVEIEGLQPIE